MIGESVSGSPAKESSPASTSAAIEHTIAWLGGYHRLSIRYDRKDTHYCGLLTLAAALTCNKKLAKERSAT